MIREIKTGYVEGNNYIQIKERLSKKDEESVLNKVFGYTINEGKYYLVENLKLNILKPFIRISTSFYTPSIQLKDKINIPKAVLFNKYTNQYNINPRYSQFEGFIDQLNRAGIIEEQKGVLFVVDDIIERISKNIGRDKELIAVYA